jgi:hypothetical protein
MDASASQMSRALADGLIQEIDHADKEEKAQAADKGAA